jgi:hypothetical protein
LRLFLSICIEEAVCFRRFSVYGLDLEVLEPHCLLFRMEEYLCENFQHVTVPWKWLHICCLRFQNYTRRDIGLLASFSNPPSPQLTQGVYKIENKILTSVTVQTQSQNCHLETLSKPTKAFRKFCAHREREVFQVLDYQQSLYKINNVI